MKLHQTKESFLAAFLLSSTLAFAQPLTLKQSNQSMVLRLGQGFCVTMPKLHTTYISSSLSFAFQKYNWLRVRVDGCVDLLEDHLGNKDYIIGTVPMGVFTAVGFPFSPFLELGVGVNYVSDLYLSGRALGSHILFSPTLGVGIHLNENFAGLTLAYTFRHLSNASLYDDNDGINLQYITVSFGF